MCMRMWAGKRPGVQINRCEFDCACPSPVHMPYIGVHKVTIMAMLPLEKQY